MKITWIGHACFKIENSEYSIVIDPYEKGYVPGLLPVGESAHQVLCSHEHKDHNARQEVQPLQTGSIENSFDIEVLETYHDEVHGAKRGDNQIFLISDGTARMAHLGDLGCDLTAEQKEKLSGLDVLLVPVGGFYTIDGKQAAELVHELKPRIVIPMHYRDEEAGFGFDVISEVTDFADHFDRVIVEHGSSIDTDREYQAQVIVLQPMRKIG